MRSRLNSLKSKVDKLDVDELKPLPVDVVKKTIYDELVKKDNTIVTSGLTKKKRQIMVLRIKTLKIKHLVLLA